LSNMASSIKALFILAFFTTWQCSSGTLYQSGAPGRDQVSRIHLPIHPNHYSGGFHLSIKLETGGETCSTREVYQFSRGQQLNWHGSHLGRCRGFSVDSSTRVYLQTVSNNEYQVQGTMTIYTSSSTRYQAQMETGWRSHESNGLSYGVSAVGDYVNQLTRPEACPTDETLLERTSCRRDQLRTYDVTQERFPLTCTTRYGNSRGTGCNLVSKTFDPNHPDPDYYHSSGFRCIHSDFEARQFQYCCLTHRVKNAEGETMIPKCDNGRPEQPEQATFDQQSDDDFF